MGGHASAPAIPAIPPPIPATQMPGSLQAGKDAMNRAANTIGPAGTILTGPTGLNQPATTGSKTLLGS